MLLLNQSVYSRNIFAGLLSLLLASSRSCRLCFEPRNLLRRVAAWISPLALLRVLEPKVDHTHALGLCNVDPIHLFGSTPVHHPDSLLLKHHA
jgi:hypothetical protein